MDGAPAQVVAPAGALRIEQQDLGGSRSPSRRIRAAGCWRRRRGASWTLGRGPLFRSRLLRLASEEHLLLLTCTTSCPTAGRSACWSRELAALYAAVSRGPAVAAAELPIQYADFAAWQRELAAAARCWSAQLAYWKAQLAGAAGAGPADRPARGPPSRPSAARSCSFTLPAGARREALRGLEPARGRDPVHDAAGGVPGAARALHAARTTSSSASPIAGRNRGRDSSR